MSLLTLDAFSGVDEGPEYEQLTDFLGQVWAVTGGISASASQNPRPILSDEVYRFWSDLHPGATASTWLVNVPSYGGWSDALGYPGGFTAATRSLMLPRPTHYGASASINEEATQLSARMVRAIVGGAMARLIQEPAIGDTATLRPVRQLDRWVTPVMRRLGQILSLSDNWDDHRGRAISPQSADAALQFLYAVMRSETAPPSVLPTSDGGIQIEWHRDGLDVEVLFSGDEEDGLYVYERATDSEWEGDPVVGFRELDLADRLIASEVLLAA
jgi:hypothetical protein